MEEGISFEAGLSKFSCILGEMKNGMCWSSRSGFGARIPTQFVEIIAH